METAAFVPSPTNTFLFLVDPCCTDGENNAGNTEAENNCCLPRGMHLENLRVGNTKAFHPQAGDCI